MKKQSAITSAKLRKFFKQLLIIAFFGKRSTIIGLKHIFSIYKALIEEIVQKLMLPAARENDGINNEDSEGLSPGDRGMNIFDLQYAVANDESKV